MGSSISSNPTVATIDIGTHATDWLWAVFAVMLLSDLIVIAWMWTLPKGSRIFHQLSAAILTTASVAYFCMASDLGATAVPVEFVRANYRDYALENGLPTRSIWYARYVDWTITTPLLLLEILLCTGLPLSDIFTTVFFDVVMIVTGLIGSLVASSYKWGLFVMGCFAMFYVLWVVLGPGRASSKRLSPSLGKSYLTSAGILAFLWCLYPIAWGLADGGNVISPTGEMVFYGVLDLLAKPVFCFLHLFMLRKEDLTVLALQSGKFSESAPYNSVKPGFEMGSTSAGVTTATGGRPMNARRRTSERRTALEAQEIETSRESGDALRHN